MLYLKSRINNYNIERTFYADLKKSYLIPLSSWNIPIPALNVFTITFLLMGLYPYILLQ